MTSFVDHNNFPLSDDFIFTLAGKLKKKKTELETK